MPRYHVHTGPLAILDTRPDKPPADLVYASVMLGGLLFAVVPEDWATGESGAWWRRQLEQMTNVLNAAEDSRLAAEAKQVNPYQETL